MGQLRSDGTGSRNGPGLRQTGRVLGLTRRMVSLREIWGITGGKEIQYRAPGVCSVSFSFFLSFLFPFFFFLPFHHPLPLFFFPSPSPPLFLPFPSQFYFFFFTGWDVRQKIGASYTIWGLLYPRRGLRPEGTKPFPLNLLNSVPMTKKVKTSERN